MGDEQERGVARHAVEDTPSGGEDKTDSDLPVFDRGDASPKL